MEVWKTQTYRQLNLHAVSSVFTDGTACLFGTHEKGFYSSSHSCVYVPPCAFSASYDALNLHAAFDLRIDRLTKSGAYETISKLHHPDIYAALTQRLRLMIAPKLRKYVTQEYSGDGLYFVVRRHIDDTADLFGVDQTNHRTFSAVLPYEWRNQPREIRMWESRGETFINVAGSAWIDSRIQRLLDPASFTLS